MPLVFAQALGIFVAVNLISLAANPRLTSGRAARGLGRKASPAALPLVSRGFVAREIQFTATKKRTKARLQAMLPSLILFLHQTHTKWHTQPTVSSY